MGEILTEKGVVIGNVYNKYEARNPIAKWIMARYYRDFFALFDKVPHHKVYEVGCGEGYLTKEIINRHPEIVLSASDFSNTIIEKAQRTVSASNLRFQIKDIYQIEACETADLVIASEVLEHLLYPEKALEVLQAMSNPHCLISVPQEPVWRLLNMLRGKYLRDLGNTPGHINHWTTAAFLKLVSNYFSIIDVRTPLPFTIVLCKRWT